MGINSTWPERKRERNKVVDLECSRFSPRRPVPSNRRSSTIVTQKLCPFESVEVLLDTPPGSPKNCPEAKGGSVRVQISLSRPVSFFMVKPRSVEVEISRGVNFVTLAGSSLSRQVALPDHGVGLDGQSCSCLIVGWPVGSFISNPGCWTVDRSCSCLIVGRLIDHISRTVRECYSSSILSNGGSGGSGPTTLLNMFPVAVSSLVTAS
ncbi:hypothetical protein F2Q69_00002442 [Brassica cretica]|uniref:Uncharacterized protein n=1 Tax=Brassica cretica TaxID=69181 RepID=A0A8S9P9F7_BRACR|nr:hypothetical protein F2Q69_00002442 [Brassica cretica]